MYINNGLFAFIACMITLALISAIALALIWSLGPATALAQCTTSLV